MQRIYRNTGEEAYEAFINGGCLNYRDGRGAYKIPIGRRSHHTILILEDNAQVTRSLSIDLLTGDVYYEIDSHTDSGLAYYYDMNSTKVWNNRILRLLHSIRQEEYRPEPEIRSAIRQLPCADWEEILSVLPGWKEALADRYERLFLPHREVTRLEFHTDGTGAGREETARDLVLCEAVPGRSGQQRTCRFQLLPDERGTILRYENNNIGAEFFNEDEKYERILTPEEKAWVDSLTGDGRDREDAEVKELLIRFLRRELEIVSG